MNAKSFERLIYYKVALSGLIMAIFVIIQYFTKMASFLYALCYLYPFLMLPLALSSFLGTIMSGGLGIIDMAGGFLVGIITSGFIILIKRFRWDEWFVGIPIFLIPGLIMPLWLSYLMHVQYNIIASGILIFQLIPAATGVLLVKKLKNRLPKISDKAMSKDDKNKY
jgi:hypothetical protein